MATTRRGFFGCLAGGIAASVACPKASAVEELPTVKIYGASDYAMDVRRSKVLHLRSKALHILNSSGGKARLITVRAVGSGGSA